MRFAVAAVILGCAATAEACHLPGGGKHVEGNAYSIAYRTQPERISVGEHFAMELAVCSKATSALPETIGIDAWMPEHRHGMNYKAGIRALGQGRFTAEGLMLHMPGRWEFIFDVGGERLADSVRME